MLMAEEGLLTGSSPPVWGTWGGLAGAAVHPHLRGEYAMLMAEEGLLTGSSPRPWGTPPLPRMTVLRRRFIPTPVGNTQPQTSRGPQDPVHPHARGEYWKTAQADLDLAGSSPRPWGILFS